MILFPRLRRRVTRLLLLLALPVVVCAHEGPLPVSLKGVPVPDVPGLYDGPDPIIVDRARALALGKALFWDINVGSDGIACASCHFHAGADHRARNQVAPTGIGRALAGAAFENAGDGVTRGPNYLLRRADFPLVQAVEPFLDVAAYGFSRSSDDVVGSAGTFGGDFRDVQLLQQSADDCGRMPDAVYHAGATGTRRVVQRNAPTVINAVFNHRNFWDGRANNVFNGSSPWGDRDPQAGVWVRQANGSVTHQRLHLINSSLASQAVTPPVNDVEMACRGRRFADLGRKLMWRRPLASQHVHWQDSVLGAYANSSPSSERTGLKTYYVTLVRQAFNPKYWSSTQRGAFGAPAARGPTDQALPYNQYEANFAMFFALALQVYQASLVSDDAPFDRSQRDADGIPVDLSPSAIRGMSHFRDAHCNQCHLGPTLSTAALDGIAHLYRADPTVFRDNSYPFSATGSVVIRTVTAKGSAFTDTGFAATGVADDHWDPGLAANDVFGHPLSFARQYPHFLAGNIAEVFDAEVAQIRACDLGLPVALDIATPSTRWFTQLDGVQPQPQTTEHCFQSGRAVVPTPAAAARELANPATRKLLVGVESAFKVPTLRNVELTGPYMHNGGMASLTEVLEFYARGGNFTGLSKKVDFVFPQVLLANDAAARADLLEFLKSLTDERVRYERAPFDHPALPLLDGHVGDATAVAAGNPLDARLGRDRTIDIPAVGAAGRSDALRAFEDQLTP